MKKLLMISLILWSGCSQKDESVAIDLVPAATIEHQEVLASIGSDVDVMNDIETEEPASIEDGFLASDFIAEMIAYLENTAAPQEDSEVDIDLEDYYPVAMLLGQHVDEWIRLYGPPSDIWQAWEDGPDNSRPYDIERTYTYTYREMETQWQGRSWVVSLSLDADLTILGVKLFKGSGWSDLEVFRVGDPALILYTKLTDELRRQWVMDAVADGRLKANQQRLVYAYLMHQHYLTKDDFLVDFGFFALDSALAPLLHEGADSLNSNRFILFPWVATPFDSRLDSAYEGGYYSMDVASWMEDFPSSPFAVDVGSSLLSLLRSIKAGQQLSYYPIRTISELRQYMVEEAQTPPEWGAPSPYYRLHYTGYDSDNRLSLVAYQSEQQLGIWQGYRHQGSNSYGSDLYIVRERWQEQDIEVTYRVLDDVVVSRSFAFVKSGE
jgi:hypothetical protein